MLTLKLISEDTERVIKGLEKKHFTGAREAVEKVLEYDKIRRESQQKVDSNKLGFALAIGGGKQVQTATNEQTQALITAPVDGCYMTGVGDLTGNTAKIDYAAIVTPLSNTMKNATVANVVFVIEWDTVA